ncbi:MAG TPA: PAS domain-containing protein [Burkholderiales bacterium]|nr:PAS domain-containing protein [Burkholderiales bacterium]
MLKRRTLFQAYLPVAVLIAALALTGLAWWWARDQTLQDSSARFDRLVNRKVRELETNMHRYEYTLRGMGGLLASSGSISPADWSNYIAALNLSEDAGVLVGFGFSPLVEAKDIPAHVAAMRRTHPDYQVVPDPASRSAASVAPVTLAHLLDNRGSEDVRLGADQLADPRRAEAMQRAVATRGAALTARLEGEGGPLTVLYQPVYRGGSFMGYAQMLFRVEALAAAVGRDELGDLALSLYDGRGREAAGLLYSDMPRSGTAPAFHTTRLVDVAGRAWTMDFVSTPDLEARYADIRPLVILGVGGFGSLLLFALVWSLTRTGRRAEEIAQRSTQALSDQMALTEALVELNPNPIFRKDLEGRYLQFNRAWERMTGRSRNEWIGKNSYDTSSPEAGARYADNDSKLLGDPDAVSRQETRITALDGRVYDVIISKSVLRRADGTLAGFIGTLTDFTEVKRLTEELSAQREQLELVNRSAQAGVWDRDLASGRTYASPRFYEMAGYPLSADLAPLMTGGLLVHPDDRQRFISMRTAHFARQTPNFSCEYRLLRADGSHTWVNGRGLATFDADGKPVRFTGSIIDITIRKRAQAELERQREQLELVHQSSQAGVWDRHLPGGPTYLSPRFREMLGYGENDDVERNFGSGHLLRPEDRDHMIAVRNAHFTRQTPNFNCEYRLRRADGGFLWVNGRGLATFDADGKPVRFTGSIIDITSRKTAQAELERQREQLELVVESSRAGIWDTDLTRQETVVSPRYREILGLPADDGDGRTGRLVMRVHPQDEARVMAMRALVLSRGGIWDEEFRMRRGDGEYVWINARGKTVHDASGKAVRFAGAIVDISVRKEAETALLAANAAALEAARAKSTFLATMSHEIRTPLNGVIGSAGLLVDTRLNSEQREYVETIRHSGNQLLSLINDILDFSKIESGQMELESEPFEVAPVIEDAFDLVAENARGKRLELLHDLTPNAPRWVRGDVTRVRQVLINLVTNAVKFTDKGEVCVTVTALPAPGGELGPGVLGAEGEMMLEFAVRDTGIGVPADKIGRLFNAFSQVDASTTRKYGGTGLGLAICQRLVELMGGTIRAESVAGQGSSFVFTISTRAVAAPRPPREGTASFTTKRALVIDDYPTNRRILRSQCASWGLVADEAASGPEALALISTAQAEGRPYDVVISDMLMPDMDGLDVAAALATLRTGQKIRMPLIILSSASKSDAFEGREVPDDWINAYLMKPARQSQIYNALLDALAPERLFDLEGPEQTAPPMSSTGSLAQIKLLLAEDNEVNRRIALRMLQRLGQTAEWVENGAQALAAVHARDFDCVLMDVQMPEMDGLTATRRINAELAGRRPYIIAMTANAMAGDREACLAAGMDDYIAKPIQLKTLADALAKVASARQHRTALAAAPGGGDNQKVDPAEKPEMTQEEVLDMAQIEELISLDETRAVLAEFVGMFTTQVPERIAEMRSAFQQGDLARIAAVAHSLKGASGNLGARLVAETAKRMEHAGKAGIAVAMQADLDELDVRYAEAEAALKALLPV